MQSGKRRRGTFGLLTLTHVVNDLYAGAIPAIIPFLANERAYNYVALSVVTLSANLLASVLQPLFGVIADRHRLHWMVAVGMLVSGVGVGVAGIAPGYVLLCVAVSVSGLGSALYHPEATRTARELSGASASRMSVFSVGGNLGIAVAPLLVSAVLGWGGLAATPLLAIPAVALAAAYALVTWRLRRGVRDADAPTTAPTPVVGRNDWRSFWVLMGVVAARSMESIGLAPIIALLFVHEFDTTPAFASSMLSVLGGAGVVGTLVGGWLADRMGRVSVLRVSFVVGPLALLALGFSQSLAIAIAAVAVFGFAAYLPFSVQMTLGHEYLPRRVALSSGMTLGLGMTLGGLFAPGLGAIADAVGPRTTLYWGVGLLLVALVLTRFLPEPGRDALTKSRLGR